MSEIQGIAPSDDMLFHIAGQQAWRLALYNESKPVRTGRLDALDKNHLAWVVSHPSEQSPVQKAVIAAIELGQMRASRPGLFDKDAYDQLNGAGEAERITNAARSRITGGDRQAMVQAVAQRQVQEPAPQAQAQTV